MSADAERKPRPERTALRVLDTPETLRNAVADWRKRGDRIALVPTMGALHDGHLSLVTAAQARAERVVVSIFVNPTQFAPTEDLARYPRTFSADQTLLEAAGVDAIYAPDASAMYPHGFSTRIVPEGPALAGLEDRSRPHFFAGVATVVAKLLLQAIPSSAIFGEKDYQQLRVVKGLARDLDIPVEIVGVPTVREADGLAMSSRNRYLGPDERARAASLYRALADAAIALRQGRPVSDALATARKIITAAGAEVDYLELRDAATLDPIDAAPTAPARLLVAARIGATRLIDNVAV